MEMKLMDNKILMNFESYSVFHLFISESVL